MFESSMIRTRIDKVCRRKLPNVPKPLEGRMVDDILDNWLRQRNVAVNGIFDLRDHWLSSKTDRDASLFRVDQENHFFQQWPPTLQSFPEHRMNQIASLWSAGTGRNFCLDQQHSNDDEEATDDDWPGEHFIEEEHAEQDGHDRF